MNRFPCIAILAAGSLIAACAPQGQLAGTDSPPQVSIVEGTLEGVRDGNILSFKSIPYAAAPIGELRWRPPQPANTWHGVRQASEYGAICPQVFNAADNGTGPLPMNEDCLTLNVFAPADAKQVPVMFWIHGGGFVNGSATAALYDGTALAAQGVVVVTINYRLGRLGFFAHPSLTAEAEAKGEPVGNYALMDMIAALNWVQRNIEQFGGDPRQVTIFGESAGGIAVNNLMISPLTKDLFVRAIVQSGLGREPAATLQAAEQAGVGFADSMGLADASAADLRGLTPEQMLNSPGLDVRAGAASMIDGRILTASVGDAFTRGIEARIPYIIGYNDLELPVQENLVDTMLAADPMMSAPARASIEAAYPDRDTYLGHVVSDLIFTEPALQLARLHARHAPTWVYRFSVLSALAPDTLKGAPHASDRQYVFNTLKASTWPTNANDAAQAEAISAYWASFARHGDPNGGDRPNWPTYDPARDELLDFTNGGPVVTLTPHRRALDAFSALYQE